MTENESPICCSVTDFYGAASPGVRDQDVDMIKRATQSFHVDYRGMVVSSSAGRRLILPVIRGKPGNEA